MSNRRRVFWMLNILSAIIGIRAFVLLWSISWEVAIAVFLMIFANNLMLRSKEYE